MFVLFFKAGFFLLLTNYGFISCVYFAKFKGLPTLRKLTIYVISIESRVRKYPISTAVLTKSALLVLHNLSIRRLNKTLNPNIRVFHESRSLQMSVAVLKPH